MNYLLVRYCWCEKDGNAMVEWCKAKVNTSMIAFAWSPFFSSFAFKKTFFLLQIKSACCELVYTYRDLTESAWQHTGSLTNPLRTTRLRLRPFCFCFTPPMFVLVSDDIARVPAGLYKGSSVVLTAVCMTKKYTFRCNEWQLVSMIDGDKFSSSPH